MPRRDVRHYLHDVVHSCGVILRLTSGKDLVAYSADEGTRLAVERSFEIIGEALRQALVEDESLEHRIADARKIIAFRNFLAHAYHLIDHSVVWLTVQQDVPQLLSEARALLSERGGGTPVDQ